MRGIKELMKRYDKIWFGIGEMVMKTFVDDRKRNGVDFLSERE